MKKAGKIIALILMGVIISMNLLTMIGNLAGASGDFSLLPYTLLSVKTGSMEPEIRAGDLIIDREVPYEEIRVGDTVTFERNGEFITHRVVRFEGSRLVTKGLANNAEDKAFGPENYLGKVVKVIPGLGKVYSFFTNPLSLLCGLIVLAGIFWSGRIADRITGKKVRFSLVRCMSFLMAASFFLLTPSMTAAKYTVLLNGNGAVAADSRYIGSDSLTEEGIDYEIDGWTGDSYELTVSVNAGENELKYNKTGQDITYKILVLKLAQDGTAACSTDYSVTVLPQEGVIAASAAGSSTFGITEEVNSEVASAAETVTAGPYVLKGNDDRMITNNFTILLEGNDPQGSGTDSLKAGDRIAFRVLAVTDSRNGYYKKLSADFRMTVYPHPDFVNSQEWSTSSGNTVVDYELTTGLHEGSGSKNIKVTWDSTELYLNEYENNAYSIIHNFGSGRYFPGNAEDHNAWMIMTLTSFSSVKLQFFKYDRTLEAEDISINAALYTGQ